jgi:hypothetical protein
MMISRALSQIETHRAESTSYAGQRDGVASEQEPRRRWAADTFSACIGELQTKMERRQLSFCTAQPESMRV